MVKAEAGRGRGVNVIAPVRYWRWSGMCLTLFKQFTATCLVFLTASGRLSFSAWHLSQDFRRILPFGVRVKVM